jgi:hypothetical protein
LNSTSAREGECAALPTIGKLIARNETLKQRAVVPTYRALARTNIFYPAPRVFANSFPKAGTHLLSALLGHLPRMMFSGLHRSLGDLTGPGHAEPDWKGLRSALRSVRCGQYATGHFPHDPTLNDLLAELEFATVMVLRDPRDVAVSAVHYALDMHNHDLHRRFATAYSSFDERLLAVIEGFEADAELGRGQEAIGVRLARYVPWLAEPAVCTVRYEQLIGPAGGGSGEAQRDAVRRVAQHVGRPLDDRAAQRVAARVWSPKSSTFRSGRSGGWRERFTDEHVAAFKRVAGAELIALGYERDLDW